jgi:methionyl-tRNA formyltransferase
MPDKTTIVFLGSPAFSCPFLAKLVTDDRFDLQAVITQEDKPSGRQMMLTPTPVKVLAGELHLPLFQPHKLNRDKDLIEYLKKLKPDFLVVVAYGQILNQTVLDIPSVKPVNVHGSILPKYRGASPIEQALLNDDRETGLSIMEMVLKMDAGGVYSHLPVKIEPDQDSYSLRLKLAELGSTALPDLLIRIKNRQLTAFPQNEDQATYCQKIIKIDGLCNPLLESSSQIYNKFRAFKIWPGIYLSLNGKSLKLLEISPTPGPNPPAGRCVVKEF